MNKQRKVLITTTYNEMGIIIDTKVEEVAQPNLQPTCNQLATDTITREAAIDALDKRFDSIPMNQTTEILLLRKDLRELPSAQPERMRGKWIYNSPVTMKCNQCGLVIKDWDWHRFKYCPGCGADMREVDDERPD